MILCDVPCSGDGTLRKAPRIWQTWNPRNSFQLHALQVRILQRALSLLRVGGTLVYSTCTISPIECEAVVAAACDAFRGCVTIEDSSSRCAGLPRTEGLQTWRVCDAIKSSQGRRLVVYDSFEAACQAAGGIKVKSAICESMFPPAHDDTWVKAQLKRW